MRKDSKKPASSATASSFSLGMTMVVSTDSMSLEMPRSACCMRRLPSNENCLGRPRPASAPISQHTQAQLGAPPVSAPPPRPWVQQRHLSPLFPLVHYVV